MVAGLKLRDGVIVSVSGAFLERKKAGLALHLFIDVSRHEYGLEFAPKPQAKVSRV